VLTHTDTSFDVTWEILVAFERLTRHRDGLAEGSGGLDAESRTVWTKAEAGFYEDFVGSEFVDDDFMATIDAAGIDLRTNNPDRYPWERMGTKEVLAVLNAVVFKECLRQGAYPECVESGLVGRCLDALAEADAQNRS
jgi:hypothetical protein